MKDRLNKKKYEYIEHTADIGLISYGKTLSEIFENAALGMFNIISDTSTIEPKEKYKINISSENIETLFIDWLSELLTLWEIEYTLFSVFFVDIDEKKIILNSVIKGEKFDKNKHIQKIDIKAVTYHTLEINKIKGYGKVLFDI